VPWTGRRRVVSPKPAGLMSLWIRRPPEWYMYASDVGRSNSDRWGWHPHPTPS